MVSSGLMAVGELPSYSELAFLSQNPPLMLQTHFFDEIIPKKQIACQAQTDRPRLFCQAVNFEDG
jgi:hypothetical protein